jgi:membrane associated rhomboid family serine protease
VQLSTSWSRARVTLALTIATTTIWLLLSMLNLSEWAIVWGGFTPARFVLPGGADGVAPLWLTPLTAAFLHANFIHLAFNLVILVFCGRPTEAVLGPVGFGLLYLLGTYVAAGAHYLMDPSSFFPMIGASGAISAVLGAYAILFGRNKVKVANPTLALWLNALWLMAAWVVLNVVVVFTFAGMGGAQIAVGAHIGGFLVGLALANPLLLLRYRKA